MAGRIARVSAGLIALASLAAMAPPILNGIERGEGLAEVTWGLLRYFTILTNLAIGLVFARLAWRGRAAVSPQVTGGLMLAIVLVGLVYNFVLPPMPQPDAISALGDQTHHVWVPLAVPLWWLAFAPHGTLRWRDPLLWALYPLAYSAYAIARSAVEGTGVPYFFVDAAALGWPRALLNMGGIALAFVLTGLAVVAIDRRLPR